ncbi:acyltransferase [Chromobacterium violaceum]|uniref:acyltransferase n=1 Tax=Chromobacterium violaceum TaxID=536 RepID=UPI001CE1D055|nr:acyltransferase [Chromobacterium violaceum]
MTSNDVISVRVLRKIGFLCRYAYAKLVCPINVLLFKRFAYGSFVHPLASVRNYRNISIGAHTTINRNVILWPSKLYIGDWVEINPGTVIYGEVAVGNFCMIGPNVVLAGGTHGTKLEKAMRFQPSEDQRIVIGEDVWIGANASVTGGVVIAEGCIIGAGSVVTRSTAPFGIYVGSPARLISYRK